MQPELFMEFNSLNNFDKASYKEHICKVSTKATQVDKEEKLFKEIVDARTVARTHSRTMDDGQWAITKAHHEDRWAKKHQKIVDDSRLFGV